MGLDFKEAFSSFLHQYFHANATFWNSVKICGNFKVAVDDYQEDYLFSEVITKTDCCCSNGLDKLNTPLRGSGQAPIIIKEEPNEVSRPLSGDVVATSNPSTNTSSSSSSSTNTVISNSSALSTTSASNGTVQTVADKSSNCSTSSTSSHIESVLSTETTYTVPPTRPSRWYISNCQPQTSADIDGRALLPSMPLLVTSTPAAPSSPNKITDMLQITSCDGEEEAAALQTFSSAQEPISTEESVTLQGSTSFATETQVTGQPPSLLSSYMKTPVDSVGQFVDQSIAKEEPISSINPLVGHVDISTVDSVVSGVHQVIPKRESTSDCEDQGSETYLSYSHKHNAGNQNADLLCLASGSSYSNHPTTAKPHLSPKSKCSISTTSPPPSPISTNLTRQLILRRTASPSMKVFRKTLNKALRLSYQKAANIKGLTTEMKCPNVKLSATYVNPLPSVAPIETSLIDERNQDMISRTHGITSPNKEEFICFASNQVLNPTKSIKSTLPVGSPGHKFNPNLVRLPSRSSLRSSHQTKHKVINSLSTPLPTTASHEALHRFISHQQTPTTLKTVDSIDLTIDSDTFPPRSSRSNDVFRSQFLCTTCGKYFTRKSSLNEHKKDVHDKTNDKFICCICSKRFTRPQHLRDHMNIHYMYKPHKCTSCGHKFFNKISLLRHKRKCFSEQPTEHTVIAI